MNFGIEDININNLDKAMDEVCREFGNKSTMCRELAIFSVTAVTELQKLSEKLKKAKKLKIED